VYEADHLCHQMSTAAMSAFYLWVKFNLCAINDFIIIIIIIRRITNIKVYVHVLVKLPFAIGQCVRSCTVHQITVRTYYFIYNFQETLSPGVKTAACGPLMWGLPLSSQSFVDVQ
jgi:hypothetical protein